MKKIALHWQIIIALILGVLYSYLAISQGWMKFTLYYLRPFGDIFIRLLKMLAVPLVLFSIIKGVAGLSDISRIGRLGAKTFGLYVLTTVVSVTIGLGLVNLIEPGNKIDPTVKEEIRTYVETNVSQDDGFQSLQAKQDATNKIQEEYGPLFILVESVPDNIFSALTSMSKMLQVIFFAIFFGIGLLFVDKRYSDPVNKAVDGINEVILLLIQWVMRAAPFFVFCLLAGQMARLAGDNPAILSQILQAVGWYMITVILGLGIMALVFYPSLVAIFVRHIGYLGFMRKLVKAQSVAFSTSSSAATLPVTMDVVENDLGVSPQTTNFILPIGATINMDGTSMFQGITAVFLAQFFAGGMEMTDQLLMIGMATLASIGAPAVPSAGLVLLMGILASLGYQAWWVALVFPIDRILDMTRTAINVTGDAAVATLIAQSEGEFSSKKSSP
ncbi:MAG TPA: dicarboxylate/amino acid:cation symporter [Bacteroidetes bacterium]|nr:dicarboxylate/amino acid:cation symporter [Bacteroidota bacterium]